MHINKTFMVTDNIVAVRKISDKTLSMRWLIGAVQGDNRYLSTEFFDISSGQADELDNKFKEITEALSDNATQIRDGQLEFFASLNYGDAQGDRDILKGIMCKISDYYTYINYAAYVVNNFYEYSCLLGCDHQVIRYKEDIPLGRLDKLMEKRDFFSLGSVELFAQYEEFSNNLLQLNFMLLTMLYKNQAELGKYSRRDVAKAHNETECQLDKFSWRNHELKSLFNCNVTGSNDPIEITLYHHAAMIQNNHEALNELRERYCKTINLIKG